MHLPSFKGKTVSLVLVDEDQSQALHNPKFEVQGKRLFLIGTIPAEGSANDWVAGLQGAVAWDRVQEYIVFDSAEDYHERLALSRRKSRTKSKT